jgi:hypothetical protein
VAYALHITNMPSKVNLNLKLNTRYIMRGHTRCGANQSGQRSYFFRKVF